MSWKILKKHVRLEKSPGLLVGAGNMHAREILYLDQYSGALSVVVSLTMLHIPTGGIQSDSATAVAVAFGDTVLPIFSCTINVLF